MMSYRSGIVIVFTLLQMAIAFILNEKDLKIFDLTHTFDSLTPYWKMETFFNLTVLYRGRLNYTWYEANEFAAEEHGGTHLDAPSHFAEGNLRLHEIALDNLIGTGIRVDVRDKVATNRDYQIDVADFQSWERENGEIPKYSIILLDTGWSKFWPNVTLVYGTDNPSDPSSYHFPGLHPDAVRWITTERPTVKAIAIDTPSIDFGQTQDFRSHRDLAARNISFAENVANLHSLPPLGYIVFAIPVKFRDGSGGPVRIFAVLSSESNSYIWINMLLGLLCVILLRVLFRYV